MYIGKWGLFLAMWLAAAEASAEAVDPTQPIDFMPPPLGDAGGGGGTGISVNMILMRGDQALALVNGRYVRVNDVVSGAKVVSIGRNYVELQQTGGSVKHYLAGFGYQAEKIK